MIPPKTEYADLSVDLDVLISLPEDDNFSLIEDSVRQYDQLVENLGGQSNSVFNALEPVAPPPPPVQDVKVLFTTTDFVQMPLLGLCLADNAMITWVDQQVQNQVPILAVSENDWTQDFLRLRLGTSALSLDGGQATITGKCSDLLPSLQTAAPGVLDELQNCLQKQVTLDAVRCDDQPPSPPPQPDGRRLEEARLRVVTWRRDLTRVSGRGRRVQEVAEGDVTRFEVCEIQEEFYYVLRYSIAVQYVVGQTAIQVMNYVQDQARQLGQELSSQSIEVCDTHVVVEYTWVPLPSPPDNLHLPPPPPYDEITMVALPVAIGSPLLCICFCCFLFAFADPTKARRIKIIGTGPVASLSQDARYERKRSEDSVPSGPFAPLRPRAQVAREPLFKLEKLGP